MRNPLTNLSGLDWPGCRVYYARRTEIPLLRICNLFNGKARATLEQAEKLEAAFKERGVAITRWDLLYGYKRGVSLSDMLANKERGEEV